MSAARVVLPHEPADPGGLTIPESTPTTVAFHYTVLSGRMYMSCRQVEQPVGGGLNLFLGDPGS
jgi:mannose-6-phosphate isomerase-like protein (cupin superfamily)